MALLASFIVVGLSVLGAVQANPESRTASWPSTTVAPASSPSQATTQPRARVGLNDLCPISWRGTPLRQAFAELADRLGVRYILDASIPATALDEPVRMSAAHLTGQQAFRWLARMGGVSAVFVDGVLLVAAEDRLPGIWRATGTGAPADRASEEGRWAKVNSRRIDVNWVDAPLTGVAEDVSSLFGVDVLYHPALLADPKLTYMKESGVDLDRVREVLGRQLNARTELYDGALWVCPQGEVIQWLPATGHQADPVVASQPDEFIAAPLERWLMVDRSATTWVDFADAVSTAAGVPCSVAGAEGTRYPGIDAAGSVGEVLDGLRMLGMIVWNIAPEGPSSGPRINIRLREKR
jgi:hypothetical protein